MKTKLAILLLMFAGSMVAQQQSTPPGTPGQIKDELIRISTKLAAPISSATIDTLSGLKRKNSFLPMPPAMFQTSGKIWQEKRTAANLTQPTTSMKLTCVFIPSPPSSPAA
jgi:hypothetical protein